MTYRDPGQATDKKISELLWINPSARMVRHEVVDRLRQAIRLRQFSPGQRLLERELCQWTGVSRTSIREALRQLESEGLIENVPRRGPAVAVVSSDEVKDIYAVRKSVETTMTRLFIERATDREADKLIRAANALSKATKSGNTLAISNANGRFFEAFMAGCRNHTLADVVRSLHLRLILVKSVYLQPPERQMEAAKELTALANAIKARDVKRAVKVCEAHLDAAAAALSGAERAQSVDDRRDVG